MNDFVVQGVTILSASTESMIDYYVALILIFACLLFVAGIALLIAFIAERDFKWFIITPLSILIFVLGWGCLIMKECINAGPDIIYTISIDDTASYNEIENTFAYVEKQKDGLYKVRLKNIE